MANPFTLASALAGMVTITCASCGTKKRVLRNRTDRKPRLCAKCGKPLPDPRATKRR